MPSRWGQGHAPPAALEELRATRKALGLTQAEGAARVGLAKSTLAVYECGHGNITEARVRDLIKKLTDSEGNHGGPEGMAGPVVAGAPPEAAQSIPAAKEKAEPSPARHDQAAAPSRPAPEALIPLDRPLYMPAPPRRVPRIKSRTCPLPRGVPDENEACICGSPRKRHDALKYSCMDCRRGATGCQYFRPASRFNGAA